LSDIVENSRHEIEQIHVNLDEEFVGSEIYNSNLDIAKSSTYFGYCLWKPYFLKREIEKNIANDRIVVYIDSADYIDATTVDHIAHFFLSNNEAKIAAWSPGKDDNRVSFCTKRECLVAMEEDSESTKNSPMIEAGFLSLRSSLETLAIVEEWLRFCCKKECVANEIVTHVNNYPEYKVNRADQSVLSVLFQRYNLSIFHKMPSGLHFDVRQKP
jgi:hypothetical protein